MSIKPQSSLHKGILKTDLPSSLQQRWRKFTRNNRIWRCEQYEQFSLEKGESARQRRLQKQALKTYSYPGYPVFCNLRQSICLDDCGNSCFIPEVKSLLAASHHIPALPHYKVHSTLSSTFGLDLSNGVLLFQITHLVQLFIIFLGKIR